MIIFLARCYVLALSLVSHPVRVVRKKWDAILWNLCSKQRELALALARGYIDISITNLVFECERQKSGSTLLIDGEVIRTGVYSGADPHPEVTLARRRIVANMEARIGALRDALSIVRGEHKRILDPEYTSTVWQYVENENSNYGLLERVDEEWEFDEKAYFVVDGKDNA